MYQPFSILRKPSLQETWLPDGSDLKRFHQVIQYIGAAAKQPEKRKKPGRLQKAASVSFPVSPVYCHQASGRISGDTAMLKNEAGKASNIVAAKDITKISSVVFRLSQQKVFHYIVVLYSVKNTVAYFARGSDSSSRTRRSICFSMAVRRSSGRLMDGCRVNRKPISLRSWLRCLVPITSRQIAS